MPKLTMMVGLPRSGKSNWIKENKKDEIVVSADNLRWLVYGQRFWAAGEALMWAIREIILKMIMSQGFDIIIDECNTKKERREPIIKLAKSFGYDVNVIRILTNPDICKERAMSVGDTDIIPSIDRMYNQFEEPTSDEGFCAIACSDGKLTYAFAKGEA